MGPPTRMMSRSRLSTAFPATSLLLLLSSILCFFLTSFILSSLSPLVGVRLRAEVTTLSSPLQWHPSQTARKRERRKSERGENAPFPPLRRLKGGCALSSPPELTKPRASDEYDLAVVGGGSGGLAAAKEAARCGAKVVLFDYVKPSTQGATWGLGGTCVNVGCVPKKIMHYAALLGQGFFDAKKLGWEIGGSGTNIKHSWESLVSAVQMHIKSLNFGYRTGLRKAGVEYQNAYARIKGDHEVEFRRKDNTTGVIKAGRVLIAVGGRPYIPSDIPGAREFAITSDDIFSLRRHPGKVLVVGGSYIALETAGFLHEIGIDVEVAVRSCVLRGFDRQCADKVEETMQQLSVQFEIAASNKGGERIVRETREYNTVLFATGRRPDTSSLNLESVGCEVADSSSPTSWVHAVGDAIAGKPELTPVAIRQGETLARRLFKGSNELVDYDQVATTVFTPTEYGSVGLSEELFVLKDLTFFWQVYLSEFSSLEHAAVHREKHISARENAYDLEMPPNALSKLVCRKSDDNRVLGFHFVGPNAGELTQGFALALALGAKKRDFDKLVGIHPTDAESFTSLSVTKSSGESWVAAGGCGGGKCG
eukprot:jgi/Bigna1/52445/estExt_Genewise1Plus.C_80086